MYSCICSNFLPVIKYFGPLSLGQTKLLAQLSSPTATKNSIQFGWGLPGVYFLAFIFALVGIPPSSMACFLYIISWIEHKEL